MPVIEKSIVINAPVDKVFSVVGDPNFATEVPGVVGVSDIKRTDQHVGDSYTMTYSVLGMRFNMRTTVQEWQKNKRLVEKFEGGMGGTVTTILEAQGNATNVTQRVDYTMKGILPALASPLIRRMNDRTAQRALEAMKRVCERG